MTQILFSFKDACELIRSFSQQYANHCLRYVFSIVEYQVSRNIVVPSRSVMITISLHFISQSDCSILSEVTRLINHTLDSNQEIIDTDLRSDSAKISMLILKSSLYVHMLLKKLLKKDSTYCRQKSSVFISVSKKLLFNHFRIKHYFFSVIRYIHLILRSFLSPDIL